MKRFTRRQSITAVRIVARLVAAGVAGFVVFITLGEGIEFYRLLTEELMLLAAMFTAVVGLILLALPPYRQQQRILAGAILNVGGIALFCLVNLKFSGRMPGGWVFPLLLVPGVIELICRILESLSEAPAKKT